MWMQNAVRKIKRAREVGKKIRACTIIQRKVVEWIYRPSGLTAQELVFYYACLQNIRAEMRQINNRNFQKVWSRERTTGFYITLGPVTSEQISEKCDRIEAYLYHTLEV
ncbi:hypothetical protein Glove_384g36 [Diversispora epigaea]|uniref:Uncharacterized protein n=1 Tax=Diversispora epigaea TaxID=1348612 RepID=A0A397H3K7_9GLOM|nr:hypothetical protein Glove_384g36 [Diversispora epigaea]